MDLGGTRTAPYVAYRNGVTMLDATGIEPTSLDDLAGLNVVAFAGAAGTIIGIVQPFSPASEVTWTLNAFIVVVLGGIGSPAGALVGGLLLGIINTMTAQYIGPALTNAMMFLVLVVMLLVRPQGLLGNAFGESR